MSRASCYHWLILPLLFVAALICFPLQKAEAQVRPVSSYVQAVLDRADEGITRASALNQDVDEDLSDGSLQRTTDTVIFESVDTDLLLERESRRLNDQTECLAIDLFLIDQKLSEVRDAMLAAEERNARQAVDVLRSLYEFLIDRLKALHEGALDPAFEDRTWGQRYLFDSPATVCCSGELVCTPSTEETDCPETGFINRRACTLRGCSVPEEDEEEVKEEAICPFHTDYGPPVSTGYGCDATILNRYRDRPAAADQAEAIETLIEQRSNFFESLKPMGELLGLSDDQLDALSGTPRHKFRFGCGGRQSNPPPADPENQDWLSDVAFIEVRGPFTFLEPDHLRLLRAFREVRQTRQQRPFAQYLSLPSETDTRDASTFIADPLKSYYRNASVEFSNSQDTSESRGLAYFTEPQFFFRESFGALRQSVQRLATLATDLESGVRGFVRDLVYFIRRTCPLRACNDVLDRVFKLTVTDECFPYTDGSFGQEDIATRCGEGADLRL